MEEKVQGNNNKNTQFQRQKPREILPINLTDENIMGTIDYFESSILRSNILMGTTESDPQLLLRIIEDRTNDISVLNSICYGLLNQRKFLKTEMDRLQMHIDKLGESEKELLQFRILYEQYTKSLSNKEPQHNVNDLKIRVDDLHKRNSQVMDEMFQLSKTRESCEFYEKSLVDRIIFEYMQKREETSSMTQQVSRFVCEFQQQQHEISELIIDNIDLKTRYLEERDKRRKLKNKLKTYNKIKNELKGNPRESIQSVAVNQISQMNSESPVKMDFSKDAFSLDSKTKDTSSLSSRGQENIKPTENGPAYQMIKNSQNTKLMKKWRELNSVENSDGFNSILTEFGSLSNKVVGQKILNDSSFGSNNPPASPSNQRSYNLHNNPQHKSSIPRIDLDSISTSSQTLMSGQGHPLQNVAKTISKFGVKPPDSTIPSISENETEALHKSSLLRTFTRFFKS